jgi:hypothetical protein
MIARQATLLDIINPLKKEQYTVACGTTGTCSGCKNHASGNISVWDAGDFRDEDHPIPGTCHNYKERPMDECTEDTF